MEAGLGFRYTTKMVNQHQKDEGKQIVGRSAVMNHFDRMGPLVTTITKCCQGNSKR